MLGSSRELRTNVDLSLLPRAAATARHSVSEVLHQWHLEGPVADDAQLVASELVANAQRYGGQRVDLDVTLTGNMLTLAVADSSSALPTYRGTATLDEGGRGLPIVAALATRWGISRFDGGKRVWARLRVD